MVLQYLGRHNQAELELMQKMKISSNTYYLFFLFLTLSVRRTLVFALKEYLNFSRSKSDHFISCENDAQNITFYDTVYDTLP